MPTPDRTSRRFPLRTTALRAYASLFLVLSLSACFWPAEEESSLTFTLPSTFSNVPLAVGTQTYTVERGDVVRTLQFDGLVQAGTQQELYFTVDGPVAALHVENGQTVTAGQLLVELNAEVASLNVAEAQLMYTLAELRVQQAEAGGSYALEVAQLNLQIAELRLDKLRWDPNTPREDLEVGQREVDLARAAVVQAEGGGDDASRVDVTIARVQLQMAELALQRAQRDLASLQLRAPINGTIRLGQDLRVGFPAKSYVAVARLVDTGSLVIESNLAGADQEFLYEGMPVEIEVNYARGLLFPGEITVLPQPYGNGHSPLTQIVPQPTTNVTLREGAGVRVRAEIGRAEDTLWLPNATIQTVAGQSYVVVREADQLREQEIEVGLIGDERTEILHGLSQGMQVMGR